MATEYGKCPRCERATDPDRTHCCFPCEQGRKEHNVACAMRQVNAVSPHARAYFFTPADRNGDV